jgi:hypothetical protein
MTIVINQNVLTSMLAASLFPLYNLISYFSSSIIETSADYKAPNSDLYIHSECKLVAGLFGLGHLPTVLVAATGPVFPTTESLMAEEPGVSDPGSSVSIKKWLKDCCLT